MNRLPRLTRSPRAFTLIELVLAMAGCAIILAAVYGVFSRAIHLRDEGTARTRAARVRAHVVSVMRNDLRNAWISGGTLAAVLEGSQKSPNGNFPGYLKFIATTARDPGDEAPSNELQQVEYYVITDPVATDRNAGLLVRAIDRQLLAPVRQAPEEQPLLGGVESMEVSFFDGNAWQDSWSYTTVGDPVPEAVRVRIQTATSSTPIELLVPWTAQPFKSS
jgi:type II secretion system protein J